MMPRALRITAAVAAAIAVRSPLASANPGHSSVEEAKALYDKAHEALDEGDFAKALELADASLKVANEAHRKPTQKEFDKARAYLKAAEEAQARGAYKTAAVDYLAAYQLLEDPRLVFNTAEVYWLAGEDQDALAYYEKYVGLDPGGRDAEAARASAARLRQSIAARKDAIERQTDRVAKARAHNAAGREPVAAVQANAGQRTQQLGAPRGFGIGFAIVGAGVIAVNIGLIFGLRAQFIGDELSMASTFDARRYEQGRTAARNMIVFTSVGTGAIITGGVLCYLSYRATHSAGKHSRLTVAPIIGASQFMVAAQRSF